MSRPIVFIGYSHKDEQEKEHLLSHLRILQQTGMVELWFDDYINPGADWQTEIRNAIARSTIAVLLITANFLSSDFILSEEISRLLKYHQNKGLVIFPVIAKACAWKSFNWMTKMNVRPKNGKPVWGDGGSYVDEYLTAIINEIGYIIQLNQRTSKLNTSTTRQIPLATAPAEIDLGKSSLAKKQQVQIYLQGDFAELTIERRASIIDALAGLLKISPQEIEIYRAKKQQVQIYLQGDFAELTIERRASIIDALAGLLKISPQEIEIYRIVVGSIIFELGIPPEAVKGLRLLLQTNDAQLRSLEIEKISIWLEAFNEAEEWVFRQGKFEPISSESVSGTYILRIPILDHIAAGLGVIVESDVIDYCFVRTDTRKTDNFGVRVAGNSMKQDDISDGDIVLFHPQPNVKQGEIAAIVIRIPEMEPLGVIKRYRIVYENRDDLRHWLLESSNPSSPHLVVMPVGANEAAIQQMYAKSIKTGKIIQLEFYKNAKVSIAGKLVGVIKQG